MTDTMQHDLEADLAFEFHRERGQAFVPTANLRNGWVVGHRKSTVVARLSLDAPTPKKAPGTRTAT